jgi:hypothetical protein
MAGMPPATSFQSKEAYLGGLGFLSRSDPKIFAGAEAAKIISVIVEMSLDDRLLFQ